jgi:hypothetical protein
MSAGSFIGVAIAVCGGKNGEIAIVLRFGVVSTSPF